MIGETSVKRKKNTRKAVQTLSVYAGQAGVNGYRKENDSYKYGKPSHLHFLGHRQDVHIQRIRCIDHFGLIKFDL